MTITGAEGHRSFPVGEWTVDFTPTSRDGDGAVHVDGTFAGTVYADVRYPYDMTTDRTERIVTFVALDPETYEEIGRYDIQHDAITALVDEWQKHPFAPEDDSRDARCADCNEVEGSRFHVGDVDYRYLPQN